MALCMIHNATVLDFGVKCSKMLKWKMTLAGHITAAASKKIASYSVDGRYLVWLCNVGIAH